MKTVFVIHNSEGTFLSKQGQWLPSVEASAVWRSPHHDVALNHMIEANAREIMLRLQIMSCPLSDKDLPLLEQAAVPKKMAAIQFDEPEAEAASQVSTEDDDDDALEQAHPEQDLAAMDAGAADNTAPDGVDCLLETYDLFTADASAPASDAAVEQASEFAQTAADQSAVIAGELETTDYSNSTER